MSDVLYLKKLSFFLARKFFSFVAADSLNIIAFLSLNLEKDLLDARLYVRFVSQTMNYHVAGTIVFKNRKNGSAPLMDSTNIGLHISVCINWLG